jgi:hypothetical protein
MSDNFLVVDAVLVAVMCRNTSLSCMITDLKFFTISYRDEGKGDVLPNTYSSTQFKMHFMVFFYIS